AEIMKFGPDKVTNGATGDIQMATRLARSMIMEWGMSDKLGRVRYQSNEQEVFLGHSVTQSVHMSEETARQIDGEIRKLIEDGETTARDILRNNVDKLHAMAKALLEYETLTGEEVGRILKGETFRRDDQSGGAKKPERGGSSVPVTGQKKRRSPGTGSGGEMEPQPQA